MPEIALLKQSHEDRFLEAGFYLGLQFNSGWVVSRILGREFANLRPFSVGAVTAGDHLPAWNDIKDSSDKHYLEPSGKGLFYHHFWGLNTPNARVYVQFPSRNDIGSLTTVEREIDGDVGYISGVESPYDGPFSVKTELITVYERYPAFQVSNTTSDNFSNVMFHFETMKYSYQLIKDKKLIKELLTGKRQCRKYTMGRTYPMPSTIPRWLEDLVTGELMRWTKDLVESADYGEEAVGQGIPKTDIERAAAHFGVPISQVTEAMVRSLPPRGVKVGR